MFYFELILITHLLRGKLISKLINAEDENSVKNIQKEKKKIKYTSTYQFELVGLAIIQPTEFYRKVSHEEN